MDRKALRLRRGIVTEEKGWWRGRRGGGDGSGEEVVMELLREREIQRVCYNSLGFSSSNTHPESPQHMSRWAERSDVECK